MKDLFALLLNWLKGADVALKAAFQFALNHIGMFIFPALIGVKVVCAFFKTLLDMIIAKLNSVTETGLVGGSYDLTVGDGLAFINTILPLNELMLWGIAVFNLWAICLLIRTIKGIKQTILF
jgi:hypothetical protein